MLFLYDLGIHLYQFLIRIAAIESRKAALWIEGRKDILHQIQIQSANVSQPIWFHFASLGEFEQGRPVLEELKALDTKLPIVITFFSPSGYEIRKDYPLAENVFYLPLDTKKNAHEFIRIVNPAVAIFTKYEYWYHYFNELSKSGIPLFIISGIFREKQAFFKWYGRLHREMLKKVSHFFVQNQHSKSLLEGLGFSNVTVNGDTRFDRVVQNALNVKENLHIKKFSNGNQIFIAGSTWREDETLIAVLAQKYPEWKFIIASHEVNETRILELEKLFPDSVRYSNLIKSEEGVKKQTLIIDNIGMLSSLYQYGNLAYIGGGFGAGLHNTQEAAAFGLAVLFGPNYEGFQEAKDMLEVGAAYSIKNQEELNYSFELLKDTETAKKYGAIAKQYVYSKRGATQSIINYLKSERIIA